MSTVACPSCNHGVAVSAKRCPSCGGTISVSKLLVHHNPKLAGYILLTCVGFLVYCYFAMQR